MYAVKRGNVEAVHALLNAEANCEIRTKQGFTPLMLASYLGHVELVLLFIKLQFTKVTYQIWMSLSIHTHGLF